MRNSKFALFMDKCAELFGAAFERFVMVILFLVALAGGIAFFIFAGIYILIIMIGILALAMVIAIFRKH
jgi:hypothetical protein